MESLRSNEADRITILHIVAPAEVGGVERVVQALAGGHSRAGHSVHVAAVMPAADHDHAFLASLRGTGAAVHMLAVPGRAYWRERTLVRDLCRQISPNVVHTHGYRPDVVDAGVARSLGIPAVTTVHGFSGNHWRNRLYERVQRAAFRRFECVIAVSAPLGTDLARDGVPAERIAVLKNAWSAVPPPPDRSAARKELALPIDGFRIGWVGRLVAAKGADVIVDALAHIASSNRHSTPSLPPLRGEGLDASRVALSVIGSGPERRALEGRAAARGVANRIRWHGTVPDAARLLPAFNILVLSSRTEGTPIVLFEAMAAGVPIVATRVGGVPDVVSAAEAWLVPAGDSAALAAAVAEVRDNPQEAARRARAARDRLASEFALGPWLASYETLYRSVMRTATTPVAAL